MNEYSQFFNFLICITCGIAGGFVYDFFYCVRYPFHAKWVKIVTDVIYWVFFAALYLFVSILTGMPNLRFFTFAGCVIGLFLYLKSFHKIVAFFARKVYNRLHKVRKERNSCTKGLRTVTKKS